MQLGRPVTMFQEVLLVLLKNTMISKHLPVPIALLTATLALTLLIVQHANPHTFLPTVYAQSNVLQTILRMELLAKYVLLGVLDVLRRIIVPHVMNLLIILTVKNVKAIALIIALIIIPLRLQIVRLAQILTVYPVIKLINAGLAILNII